MEQLTKQCAEHLEAERAVVVDGLEKANRLRKALVESDEATLSLVAAQDGDLDQTENTIVQARDSLRQQIASFFGVPQQDATIGLVVRNLKGAEQSALTRLRKEVKELAETLDTINRGNAALSSQLSSLITRTIETLTGKSTVSLYGRTGRKAKQSDVSSIYQADI